jgi:hypothetical protein
MADDMDKKNQGGQFGQGQQGGQSGQQSGQQGGQQQKNDPNKKGGQTQTDEENDRQRRAS